MQMLVLAIWLLALGVRRICVRVQGLCWGVWVWIARADEGARSGAEGTAGSQSRVFRRDFETSAGMEAHWRDLVEHPHEWWDNRLSKPNPRAPDFRHKGSRQGLWLDNARTPTWVRARFEVQE